MPDGPIGGVNMPSRIRQLPRNKVGYPIPFFVGINPESGELDFRITDVAKEIRCIRESLCWICGQILNSTGTFVAGPMCVVNTLSAEPPSHQQCASYAVKVCPFMVNPNMVRREHGIPDSHTPKEGFIARNPGVSAMWTTRRWDRFAPPERNGYLYKFGYPASVHWFAEGRPATRAEVITALETGLPDLLTKCTTMDETRVIKQNYQWVLRHALPHPDDNFTGTALSLRKPITL